MLFKSLLFLVLLAVVAIDHRCSGGFIVIVRVNTTIMRSLLTDVMSIIITNVTVLIFIAIVMSAIIVNDTVLIFYHHCYDYFD